MSSTNKYSWFATKGSWKILGFAIIVWLVSSLFTAEDELRVLNCQPKGDSIAYNTKTGRIYQYDKFREGWVPAKLNDSKSRSVGGAYTQFDSFSNIKLESVFANGNLKIRKETKTTSSLYGSESFMPNRGSSTEVDMKIVYDAKNKKNIYKVKENEITYNCKLDPEKKYRGAIRTYRTVPITGGF